MTVRPIKFSTRPSRTIFMVVNLPVLNTIVFGAVATGSINAQLALIAAGTISRAGSIPAATAPAARIGIISAVVAVLLVISVRKVMVKQITPMIKMMCHVVMPTSALPKAALKPDTTNALAIAMPPPNSISMPHGIFAAVSQSSKRSPLPFGIRNMQTTATNATLASLAPFKSSQVLQPPNG